MRSNYWPHPGYVPGWGFLCKKLTQSTFVWYSKKEYILFVKSYKVMLRAVVGFGAFIALIMALILWFTGQQLEAIFVAIWVPSLLSFSLFFESNR